MTASPREGLRIIHCFRAPVGGVFRHVRDLAEAQAAAGHQVGIVCDSITGGAYEERLFAAIAPSLALGVTRLPIQRKVGVGDIATMWRTYSLIRELQPDILHGHGAKGGALARLFGSVLRVFRYRVARLYSPHGGVLHYDPTSRSGRVFFALERLMDRFTDRLLFVCDYERRTFEAKVGRPRAPFSIAYNGLRDEEFVPVRAAEGAADLLFIGTMRDLKGPDLFIEALHQASRRLGRTLRAAMVGDGEDLEACRARVRELGLETRVRFEPPMPAREAFALARIVVVPSRAEAFPYIVIEALAGGKPVIATAVGGIPEVFGTASPALAKPQPASLAERIAAALGDEQAFAAAMPSLETLHARFGIDAMAGAVEDAYGKAIAGIR
jgi:glycosyltransferase involved in cell wall biosynthesis